MKIWSFGPCFYTQAFLIIIYVFPSELGCKDLNNYKNYKAYTNIIINQVGCNHCCIITLHVVIAASWKVNTENLNQLMNYFINFG